MIAYFDTSALLKLIIAEKGADQAILLWQQASEVVVSRPAWPGLKRPRRWPPSKRGLFLHLLILDP